jgi:Oxysterol-binding protein
VLLCVQANAEKQRLEKKQRKARKEAEEGVPIKPRWFQPVPGAKRGEALSFKYQGGYWESRAEGSYTDCRDIFGE